MYASNAETSGLKGEIEVPEGGAEGVGNAGFALEGEGVCFAEDVLDGRTEGCH